MASLIAVKGVDNKNVVIVPNSLYTSRHIKDLNMEFYTWWLPLAYADLNVMEVFNGSRERNDFSFNVIDDEINNYRKVFSSEAFGSADLSDPGKPFTFRIMEISTDIVMGEEWDDYRIEDGDGPGRIVKDYAVTVNPAENLISAVTH